MPKTRESVSLEVIEKYAPWFGGACEIGASVEFFTQKYKGFDRYAYPRISLYDRLKSSVDNLEREFGGTTGPSRADSWKWSVAGETAAGIVLAMRRFAPSRDEIATAVSNWVNTNSHEERVEIAKEMKGHNRLSGLEERAYDSVIDDPQFVAGIIDNAGKFSDRNTPYKDTSYDITSIRIYDINKVLLEALKRKYGGGVNPFAEAGMQYTIGDRTIITQNTTYVWSIFTKDSIKLLTGVRPHLLWRKEEADKLLTPA